MRVVIHKEDLRWKRSRFFIEIFMKTKRKFFFVLKKWKWKKSYVKVRKKTVNEEGGENQKATMYKWVGKEMMKDLEDVVKEIVLAIYAKEIKETKEGWRNTYLIWLMTYLETLHVLPCLEAFNA